MKEIPFAKNYKITKTGVIFGTKLGNTPLKCGMMPCGYLRVGLVCDDGVKRKFLIHRLVALVYIDNPLKKSEVNHIDGIKTNNNVLNLEWATREENQRHAFTIGLNSNSGEANGRSVLSEDDVISIYYKLLNGARNVDVAREFNISNTACQSIKTKENWNYLLCDLPDIDIKSKSNNLSESKVRWVCTELEKGVGPTKIVEKSSNLTIHQVEGIKARKVYKHISYEYKW